MRRELSSTELDILERVKLLHADSKIEILRPLIGRKSNGCSSQAFLYKTFDKLASESYLKLKANRKESQWVLSAKARAALRRRGGHV